MAKHIIVLFLLILLSACGTTHRMKASAINEYMASGDYRAIVKKTTGTSIPSKINIEEVELLDSLNAGNASFFIGDYKASIALFDNADINIDKYFSKSAIKTGSREAIATINNASVLDYEPLMTENIYLSSYKILNYLAQGDKDGARIEVNKAYAKQQSASEYFGRQIEKANKEAQKELNSLDTQNQIIWNKNKDSTINKYFSDLSQWNGYKNYMNPYTTYLSGLYFMVYGQTSSDYETASTYMRRVFGMSPSNSYVRKDLLQAEDLANLKPKGKEKYIWVIYENGMIADYEEVRVDVPAFIVTPNMTIVSFSMPKPRLRFEAFPYLTLSIGNQKNISTEILANVDSMFIAEFKRKLPSIITRAAAQTIAKSAMQYAASQQNDDNYVWASLAATIYTITTSSADLRSWHTLPKNVQIAKIKLGKEEDLSIFANGNIPVGKIKVPKGTNSIVYIRIPSIISKPVISVIKL